MSRDPDIARIKDKIRSLEEYCEELLEAMGEFEHEARRCRDRLERAGEEPQRLERELKRLNDNRRLNGKELVKARRRLDGLRRRLAQY